MTLNELMINTIATQVKAAGLYEQLAEECTELAKECMKMARIIRDDNPTPANADEQLNKIIEEYSDVDLAAKALGLEVNYDFEQEKLYRWFIRVSKHYNLDKIDINDSLIDWME